MKACTLLFLVIFILHHRIKCSALLEIMGLHFGEEEEDAYYPFEEFGGSDQYEEEDHHPGPSTWGSPTPYDPSIYGQFIDNGFLADWYSSSSPSEDVENDTAFRGDDSHSLVSGDTSFSCQSKVMIGKGDGSMMLPPSSADVEEGLLSAVEGGDCALAAAVLAADLKCFLTILASPAVKPNHLQAALSVAAQHGRVEMVRVLLNDSRVNPSARRSEALRLAAYHNQATTLRVFLDDGRADPSACHDEAIRWVSSNGHVECVRLLMFDWRVDPSAQDDEALRLAAKNGYEGVVALLLTDRRVYPLSPSSATSKKSAACFRILRLVDTFDRLKEPEAFEAWLKSAHGPPREILDVLAIRNAHRPAMLSRLLIETGRTRPPTLVEISSYLELCEAKKELDGKEMKETQRKKENKKKEGKEKEKRGMHKEIRQQEH